MKKLCSWSSLVVCLAFAGQQARADDLTGTLTSGNPPRRQLVPLVPDYPCPPGTVMPPTVMPSTVMPGAPMPSTGTPPSTMPVPGSGAPSTAVAPSPAASQAFGQQPAAGTDVASSFNPTMIGDSLLSPGFSSSFALSGYAARSSFKIADDESPRPLNRVFFNYNYFNDVNPNSRSPGTSQNDVHREVVGFEKTFLDGNASVGLRVPFVETTGPGSNTIFGDVSVVLKYALVNDCNTGNVLAGGLVVTAPSSGLSGALPTGGYMNDVLLQPWVGGIYNLDRAYLMGFSSVMIPTDSRDVSLAFSDLGIGYYLRKSECDTLITAIIPTTELHFTTPLNRYGSLSQPVGLPDIFDVTGGVHVVFHKSLYLSVGSSVPLTGPKPFDFELIAQLNYRF